MKTYSTTPENDFENNNPGTVMLGFELDMKPDETKELTVLLVPEDSRMPEIDQIHPLRDW